MALIEIDHNPSRRTLLGFGLLLALFLALVGAVAQWRFGATTLAWWLWGAAAAVLVLYYAVPKVQRPIYLSWMYAAYPLGLVMSYVVLGVIYFVVFLPIGLALRLSGRDPMTRSFDRSASTYWVPHRAATDPRRYFQQF